MVLTLLCRWAWKSLDFERLLHNDTRRVEQNRMKKDQLSSLTLLLMMCLLFSICPFIWCCLEMSGWVCVCVRILCVGVCADGHRDRQIVYCFRPLGMLAVTDGLGWGFCSGPCAARAWQVQSVRSLAPSSQPDAEKLTQLRWQTSYLLCENKLQTFQEKNSLKHWLPE